MRVFISGGCKNGKSGRAEQIALHSRQGAKPLYYVASMIPADDEDTARIIRHRKERCGMGFLTVECPFNILSLADTCDLQGSFLIDSATALLANSMFSARGVDIDAPQRLCAEFKALLPRIERVVVVSDYIYSDAAIYTDLTESFRRGLALVDQTLASLSDIVIEVCGGNPVLYKGEELLGGVSHNWWFKADNTL